MPKLRRMRLISVGHDSARFSDVTLNFTDRAGRPTNSVIWLRNGGGKTSLLSLFFAGIRPSKREFLGQRAEEKIRSIDDYVGRSDHSLVVCEWELDTENKLLFDNAAPLYLTGVFYEWPSSHKENGKAGVDRLFFAAKASSEVSELSLDGLPVFAQGETQQHRRTLAGFRRQLNQLDKDNLQNEVFHSDAQSKFMEELASHGVDPEAFKYQIHMNEREGGVSERFSFSEDAEFADFLLEMAFSQQKAKDVREQLTTFRQELVERNEQLKPELEYCEGLMTRLTKLIGVQRERETVYRETLQSQRRLFGLKGWVTDRLRSLVEETKKLRLEQTEAQAGADDSRTQADKAHRAAAVHHRQACQLRYDEVDRDFQAAQKAHAEATRLKNIWAAAQPLARCWEAQRQAKMYREQLARKQKQHAPDLARLTETSTRLANALEYDAVRLRDDERTQTAAAAAMATDAKEWQKQSQHEGEAAAKQEESITQFEKQIRKVESELGLLRREQILRDNECSEAGRERLQGELALTIDQKNQRESKIQQNTDSLDDVAKQSKVAQDKLSNEKLLLAALKQELEQADKARNALENSASLLRLLQVDVVDLEQAAAKTVELASDELRRVTESILKIRVEAAEDDRAIDWLSGDGDLLPPSRDVQDSLVWLRDNGVTAWSGWEYIASYRRREDRRLTIEHLPYVATGIVVADKDYDRVVDLTALGMNALRLRSAIAIVPAEALKDSQEILWTVIGPESDAHFDPEAAAVELNQLERRARQRRNSINEHAQWQNDLAKLQASLQSFQASYPYGWFSRHRQKMEVVEARLGDVLDQIRRFEDQTSSLKTAIKQSEVVLKATRELQGKLERQYDRVENFIRQFGSNLAGWQRDLAEARTLMTKHRLSQQRLTERADKASVEAKQLETNASNARQASKDLEAELNRLKHGDDSARQPTTGNLESLRNDYTSLLTEYEQKVNAETLEQLASAKDSEAVNERIEFERVLSQHSGIAESDVEVELRRLPGHRTAAMRSEEADREERLAMGRSGNLANSRKPRKDQLDDIEGRCAELSQTGVLPIPNKLKLEGEYQREAERLDQEAQEQLELAVEYDKEVERLVDMSTKATHESETLTKDNQRLDTIALNAEDLFNRLVRYQSDLEEGGISAETPMIVKGPDDLTRQLNEVDSSLRRQKERHRDLDGTRDSVTETVHDWSREKRFAELPNSISHRFANKRPEQLEGKAAFFNTQLADRVLEIERKLEEANKHHDRVVEIVSGAVDEGLTLLRRVSSMSKLPASLPQPGKRFVVIETKESDNPAERRARVAELIDELIHTGEIGEGLSLIQKAVRRVAVHIKVRVLHPDLHRTTQRISISEMRGKSGGERLTCAILLYCALVRLRHQSGGRKGSSVLFLDNPIGTASRVSFLDLQREVAASMNVQLIYATGVKDLNAVGALENIIRLRNSRVDRRTERRMVEVDEENDWTGQIDAARIVFNTPPGSVVNPMESETSQDEATDNAPRD